LKKEAAAVAVVFAVATPLVCAMDYIRFIDLMQTSAFVSVALQRSVQTQL
jgi:hypothetical protein